MQIEILNINDLKPYERNARKHQAADVDAIAKSIEAFGFNDPIGVWGPQNVIVEGHGRVLAARKLGLTEIPCIRLDSLTDEQRRAYALAHNKTAEISTWDAEMLPLELEDLPTYDMTGFGFDLEKVADSWLEGSSSARPTLKTNKTESYRHVHYLVTVDRDRVCLIEPLIDEIRAEGAEVRVTRNDA